MTIEKAKKESHRPAFGTMPLHQTLVLSALLFLAFVSLQPAFSLLKEPSTLRPASSSTSLDFSSSMMPTTLTSAHDVLIHPSNMLLLILAALLVASLLKTLHLVPHSHYTRVDRSVVALSLMIGGAFFLQRLWDASEAGHVSTKLFLQYFFAGGLCAFLTHAACTPIDVIKTRIQTVPGKYAGMGDALVQIVRDEGPATLLKGLGATASGYFLHGAVKFSLYELFKVLITGNPDVAVKPTPIVAAMSGLLAECVACLVLCPMEAIRIRAVADDMFPSGVVNGLTLLLKTEGMHGLYKGLPAMLLKQVPYTVGQFVSFEAAIGTVRALAMPTLSSVLDHQQQQQKQQPILSPVGISAVAGVIAGITAAVISHPGDTILSKVNQQQGDGSSAWTQIGHVVRNAGFKGLFVGLGPRLIQVSCMIGGQFLIYDSIKLWCGIRTAAALPVAAAAVKSGAVTTLADHSLVHVIPKHDVVAVDALKKA